MRWRIPSIGPSWEEQSPARANPSFSISTGQWGILYPRNCVKESFTHSPRPRVSSEEEGFEPETSCFLNHSESATTLLLHNFWDTIQWGGQANGLNISRFHRYLLITALILVTAGCAPRTGGPDSIIQHAHQFCWIEPHQENMFDIWCTGDQSTSKAKTEQWARVKSALTTQEHNKDYFLVLETHSTTLSQVHNTEFQIKDAHRSVGYQTDQPVIHVRIELKQGTPPDKNGYAPEAIVNNL